MNKLLISSIAKWRSFVWKLKISLRFSNFLKTVVHGVTWPKVCQEVRHSPNSLSWKFGRKKIICSKDTPKWKCKNFITTLPCYLKREKKKKKKGTWFPATELKQTKDFIKHADSMLALNVAVIISEDVLPKDRATVTVVNWTQPLWSASICGWFRS